MPNEKVIMPPLRFTSFRNNVTERVSRARKNSVLKQTGKFIDKRPFISFFAALGLLFLLIVLGNIVANMSKKEVKKPVITKDVSVFRIGASPRVTLQGQVEKSGVYKIIAQTAGVVQSIDKTEGSTVATGQTIIELSSNYQGSNAPSLQASLAERQYRNILDTYDTQKSLINDQRTIATTSAENITRLNQISQQARTDSDNLIAQNRSILDAVTTQITTLENTNSTDPAVQQQIQTLKGQQAQIQGGINQLASASRSIAYQTDTTNPPTLLANTQKDITLKQLDVQEKALDLSRDTGRLQAALAYIQSSLMTPASPSNGTIDRLYVHVGDTVQPGTVLALVSGDTKTSTVVVRVPETIAHEVSRVDTSVVHLGPNTYKTVPTYVSREATDGQLYSVIYTLAPQDIASVTQSSFVLVDMPIGYENVNSTDPYIPLDAVYQTQNESYVYVIRNGKAETRSITLSEVYGKFVSVIAGLKDSEQVILNRNIVAGDNVHPTN